MPCYCYKLKVGTVEPQSSNSGLFGKKGKIQLSGGFELTISISIHLLAALTVILHGNVAFYLSEFFTYLNASMSQAVQSAYNVLYIIIIFNYLSSKFRKHTPGSAHKCFIRI